MRIYNFVHKLTICLTLSVLFGVSDIKAQISPVNNIQTPEIANLGVFGTIPVSHYTGIPDISVPLYDIKVGDYVLPLSARYHLASVKPDLQSGCLGMGWNLMAGGYITRTVHCVYDELCGDDNIGHGFYSNSSKMKNLSNQSFAQMTKDKMRGDDFFELVPDEFSFSFCGYSGNFYYNENGGWTVVSDHDIKVEFNPANGEGFINRSQLEKRFRTTGWDDRSNNNRFFNKFTLVTPDGCRYEFGGLYATEYSIPYYARKTNPLIPTTWRLSKITTTDKRVIEFKYSTSAVMCDIRYIPQYRMQYGTVQEQTNPDQIGWRGFTGFLLFPACLTSIVTPNETIGFTYFQERNYGDRFFNSSKALYWENAGMTRLQTYSSNIEDPALQFFVFMNTGKLESEYTTRKTIADKLTHNVLHRISIKKNFSENGRSYYFGYIESSSERLKLSSIVTRTGIPDIIKEQWGYGIPAETSGDDMPIYSFRYDKSQTMPYRYSMTKTDSWGYYNGGEVSISANPSYTTIYPSLSATRAETLSEIKYPTGGRTTFKYEQHDYSKIVSGDHTTVTNSIGCAGGLRVAEIKNYNEDNSLVSTTKYYYSETKNGKSSGISKSLPVHSVSYTSGSVSLVLKSAGGFQTPVTNQNSPDVGYSCVIEETLDATGQSMGYKKYRYSNYDTDIFGLSHLDKKYSYSTASGGDAIAPYTSHALERGKLQSEEFYDSNGNLKRRKVIRYAKTAHPAFKTAYQQEIILNYNPYQFMTSSLGWLAETLTFGYFPESIRDTVYTKSGAFSSSVSYSYNANKLVASESMQTSTGTARTVRYKYPSDYTAYNWMKQLNILSPVIEKRTEEGTSVCTETFEYSATPKQIPYISRKTTSWGNGASSRTDFKVNSVNAYGKPTEVETDGRTNVYYWGFNGQKLFIEIENATLAVAEEFIGKETEVSESDMRYEPYCGYITDRHLMPNSIFHIYLYNRNMEMYSEILPDGHAILYKYDGLGRLREKFYIEELTIEKKILNQYDYHYK